MSGGITLGTVAAAASIAGTAYSIYSGQEQASKQKDAANQAKANADKAFNQQQEAINKANAKTPDIASVISGNQAAAKGGQSGTMLTGPSGVDPTSLNLGKTTLLGS